MFLNNNTQNKKYSFDKIKWFFCLFFLILSFLSDYYLKEYYFWLRYIVLCLNLSISLFMFFFTKKGREVFLFFQESKIEMSKVIWPTRQESLQTTLVVFLVTVIMAIILWGFDSILINIISFIINLRF